MKEVVFDILIELIESYGSSSLNSEESLQACIKALENVGLKQNELEQALHWLSLLETSEKEAPVKPYNGTRMFHPAESKKLDHTSKAFLHELEGQGIINKLDLERIMNCVVELEAKELSLAQLKWIVIMILYSHTKNQAYAEWLQLTLINNEMPERILH
jgi:Smg protein